MIEDLVGCTIMVSTNGLNHVTREIVVVGGAERDQQPCGLSRGGVRRSPHGRAAATTSAAAGDPSTSALHTGRRTLRFEVPRPVRPSARSGRDCAPPPGRPQGLLPSAMTTAAPHRPRPPRCR